MHAAHANLQTPLRPPIAPSPVMPTVELPNPIIPRPDALGAETFKAGANKAGVYKTETYKAEPRKTAPLKREHQGSRGHGPGMTKIITLKTPFLKQTPRWLSVFLISMMGLLSACSEPPLTERERRIFSSFSLTRLPPPFTETNRVARNPAAAALGKQLFMDASLSSNGKISCATCHDPQNHFIDGVAKAKGLSTLQRNTPSLSGAAWFQWQYWDGRRDSLWSQALTPLEAKAEMGSNRVAVARLFQENESYRQQYTALFGDTHLQSADLAGDASPMGNDTEKRAWFEMDKMTQEKINTVFANVGKSIGAYELTLAPVTTRFDQFVDSVRMGQPDTDSLSKQELRGARLFIDDTKTQCLECHNGPLFSNGDFHNIGTGRFDASQPGEQLDFGRVFGVQAAMMNEFNCQGRFSDTAIDDCKHLRFINRNVVSHSHGAFRTPTLRNVSNTAPYFHDGRFGSLEEIVRHYASQPVAPTSRPNELRSFPLSDSEVKELTAFLHSLAAINLKPAKASLQ